MQKRDWHASLRGARNDPHPVIARSPHFGRRGNLWCPKAVRTGIRGRKREIASAPGGASQ